MSPISIEILEKERDRIMLEKLSGNDLDFSRLREICKGYQKNSNFSFATNGTDEELWNSVISYFREIFKGTAH